MKTVTISGHVVVIYDSIEELPIGRFHKYNKYLLIDSGVGSDLNDVTVHIDRAYKYIDTNKDMAKTELQNLKQAIFLINETICSKHLAFAALVESIDGEMITDISDESMKKVVERLANAKTNWIDRFLESVKKKIDTELNLYFPNQFDDAGIKEYYDRLKRRTIMILDTILRGTDHTNQIEQIDNFLLTLSKPKCFWGKDNAEINYDKQFEDMCLLLSQKLMIHPREMSVLQFYNAFEYLKKSIVKNNVAK